MPEDGSKGAGPAVASTINVAEFSKMASDLSIRFIHGLRAAAIAQGLDSEQASRITFQTVTGSVALAGASKRPLSEMIAAVASPGGTTQAGLAILDRDDALDKIIAAAFQP